MEKGVQRWVVDISNWDPSPLHFSSCLSLLPLHHHSSVTRYVKMDDRKRALVSCLLQYALLHQMLSIPLQELVIHRTSEGKPYLECARISLDFPNFNFNVSHDGDYVGIASEPLCLVGLDIVYPAAHKVDRVPEFIYNFSSYFSDLEWENIMYAGTGEEALTDFYRYWSLKEAYVKAIGSGVSYALNKVEFHHTNWTNISVKVDGMVMKTWRFWLLSLGKGHWASIARGHPRFATESYKRSLTQTEFTEEEYDNGFHLPSSSFLSKTVDDLIAILS